MDCGNSITKAYRLPPRVEVARRLSKKIFGFGGSTSVCTECHQLHLVGSGGKCESCCKKLATFPALHCEDCYEKVVGGHLDRPRPSRDPIMQCVNCKKKSAVDSYGFCPRCANLFKENAESSKCVVCQNPFLQENVFDTHCYGCKPNCFGCGKKFTPANKTEVFCRDCEGLRDEGLCTNCHEPTKEVNQHGFCAGCASSPDTTDKGLWCAVCDVRRVKIAGEVCKKCERRKSECPFCSKPIKVTEFACNDCLNTNYGYT